MISDLQLPEQQIGWFHPQSKRFCYTDEKEFDRQGAFDGYTVPVFVRRVLTRQELIDRLDGHGAYDKVTLADILSSFRWFKERLAKKAFE